MTFYWMSYSIVSVSYLAFPPLEGSLVGVNPLDGVKPLAGVNPLKDPEEKFINLIFYG